MATKCLTTTWKQKASNFAKANNINENNAIEQLIGIMNRPESENMSDDEIMIALSDIFNAKVDRTEFTENQNKIFDTLVNREYVNLNVVQKAINTLQKCTTDIVPVAYTTANGTYKIGIIDNVNSYNHASFIPLLRKELDEAKKVINSSSSIYDKSRAVGTLNKVMHKFLSSKVTFSHNNKELKTIVSNAEDKFKAVENLEQPATAEELNTLFNLLQTKLNVKFTIKKVSHEEILNLTGIHDKNGNVVTKGNLYIKSFVKNNGKGFDIYIDKDNYPSYTTLAEEMLHPLMFDIQTKFPKLFESFLTEIHNDKNETLQLLVESIQKNPVYIEQSQLVINNEIATQALAYYLKNAQEIEKPNLKNIINAILKILGLQNFNNIEETFSLKDLAYCLKFADIQLQVEGFSKGRFTHSTIFNVNITDNNNILKDIEIDKSLPGMATSSQKTGKITLSKASFTPDEVIDHLYGRSGLKYSDQKQKVMEILEKEGITEDKLRKLLIDEKLATTFVVLHEMSHLENKDAYSLDEYMSDKALQIEARATRDAYNKLMQQVEDTIVKEPKETPLQKTAKEIDSLIERMESTYIRHKDFNNENSPYNHVYGIPTTEKEAKAYKREVETPTGKAVITGWEENGKWYKPNDVSVSQIEKILNNIQFGKNNPWGLPSSYIGNTVDMFNRDFFDIYEKTGHNLEATIQEMSKKKYPNMNQQMLDSLLSSMENAINTIKKQLGINDEEYKLITKEFPLGGETVINGQKQTVVGTTDMLLIDKEGKVHVIDFKTLRSARAWGEKLEGYTNQVNSYNALIGQNTNLSDKIGEPVLLRYDVSYPAPAQNIDGMWTSGLSYTSMKLNPNQLYVVVANEYVPIQELEKYKNYAQLKDRDTAFSISYGLVQPVPLQEPKTPFSKLTEEEQIEMKDEVTENPIELKAKPSIEDQHLANLMSTRLMSASEQQFHADNIMKLLSYMISNLQTNSEMVKVYFPNNTPEGDFTAMSRTDIIKTIGLGRFLSTIKDYYYNPANDDGFLATCDDIDISDKAQFIYDNFDAFVTKGNSKLANLESVSISKNVTDMIEDDGSLDQPTETESEAMEHKDREHWMVGFRQLSAKSSILHDIKRAMEKLKTWNIEFDENGNVVARYPKKDKFWGLFDETINSDQAVEQILSWCNKCTTIEEMVAILTTLAPRHTWLYSIIGIHTNNKEINMEGLIEKEPFRSQFFHSFRRDFTTYSVLILDKEDNGNFVWKTKIINSQAAADALMQNTLADFKLGETKIITVTNKDLEGKGEVNKDFVDSIESRRVALSDIINSDNFANNKEKQAQVSEGIMQLLQDLGIPALNLSERQNPIMDLIAVDLSSPQNSSGYQCATILKNISYITRTLLNVQAKGRTDYNPMLMGEKESTYSNYKNILQIIGPYIEDSVEASVYENGKMYYSFNTPSFLQKEIKKLSNALGKDEQAYQEYLEDTYGKYNWFKGSAGWRTSWLQMMEEDPDARTNLNHKVQICSDKTDFKDLSPFGYAISILQEYFSEQNYAWYRVPLMSNKPSAEFIHFKKFTRGKSTNYQTVITKYLRDVAFQEMIRIKSIIENIPSAESAKIKNFDISQKFLNEHPEFVEKVKNKKPLTCDDLKLLVDSGANFKFLPVFNEYLFGEKSDETSHLLLKYINGETLDKEKQETAQLGTWLEKTIAPYMTEKANKAWRNITAQGLLNFTSSEQTVSGVKREYRNYSFIGSMTSKSFNDRKNEKLKARISAGEKANNIDDKALNAEIEKEMYAEIQENFTEFVWNDKLASINIIELTTTDLAFYNGSDDFQKRFAEVHSPTLKLNLTATFMMPDANGHQQETRYSADGIERSILLADYEIKTTITEDLHNAFQNIIASSKLPPKQKQELEKLFKVIESMYKKINMTDAQAYSSPTSYRKKMGMAGKFTPEMEEAYQEICKGNFNINNIGVLMQPLKPFVYGQTTKPALGTAMPLRKVPQQHKNSEYLLFLADAILRGSNSDSKLIALFDFMEDSAYKGRERVRNGKVYRDGVYVGIAPTGKKDGEILTIGTYTGKGIDTIQFESAIKVGLQGIIDINNITDYDEILNTLGNKIYANPRDKEGSHTADNKIYGEGSAYNYSDPYNIDYVNHISFEDYGIQQEVPNHFQDHEQLIGSQQRIISIADMADDAFFEVRNSDGTKRNMSKKEVIEEYQHLHAENIKDSFETLKLDLLLDTDLRKDYIKKLIRKAFTENNDKTPAQNLETLLNEMKDSSRLTDSKSDTILKDTLLANMKKVEKERNMDSVKNLVEKICNGVNFTITDAARNQTMSNLLKNEIKKDQRYGSDLLYACSINPATGNFNIPLSDPIQSLRIQQLLHSIIKSRINKQVTSGGPVVQTSCFGLSDNLHIVWENGHIKHYECYMPIPSEEIRQAITRTDGTIMTPDEAVAAGVLSEEQRYAIGYRIPTEDKYSMIPLYIKDWVPAAAGEAIIMPAEITQQTGSDFDIDKMYIMVKSFKKVNKSGLNKKAFKEKILNEAKSHFKNNKEAYRKFVYGDIKKGGTEDSVDHYINLIAEHPGIKFTRIDSEGVEHRDEKGIIIQKMLSDDLYYKNNFVEYTNLETKEGRNNRIFDLQWSILTNTDSVEKIMNPGNFDKLKRINNIVTVLKDKNNKLSYKELVEKSDDEIKSLAKKVNANVGRNITDIETHLYYFQQNMSAAKLIGAFANNNVSHGFISLLEGDKAITMMLDDKKAFKFDGIEVRNNKFDNSIALDGVSRISKNIANFLAASVDAVKDNALAGLNMNTATVNPAMVLARLGFDIESIGLFFSNPIIVQVVEKYFIQQDISFTNLNDVIDEELKNIPEVAQSNIDEMDKQLIQTSFTKEEMAKNIINPSPQMNANMLLLLKRLNMIADQMDSITYLTKFNSVTNAAGPSLANTIIMKQKVAKLAKNHQLNPLFNNNILHILDNSELLKAFYDTTIGENGAVDLIFKPYFIQMTDEFKILVNDLDSYTQGNLTEKLINQLANDFTLFQLTKKGVIDGSYAKREYMVKQFPSEFITLVKETSSMLKDLLHKTSTGKVPVPTLTSYVNGLSADGQTTVKQEWVDLYNNYGNDMATKAIELALYNIMRGGFGYSPKTMTHLIPSFIKQQIAGYIEAFDDINDFANCSGCEMANMLDQFFRNHTNERKLCPTIDSTKYKGTTDKNGNLTFSGADNSKALDALQVSGSKQDPVYYYIIRYNNKLYKFSQSSSGSVTYVETTKLGITNDFLEYDYNKIGEEMISVFEKTDTGSNEGSEDTENKDNQDPVTSKDLEKQYTDIISQHSQLINGLLDNKEKAILKTKTPDKDIIKNLKSMLSNKIDINLPGDIIQEINTIINDLSKLC